MKAVYITNKGLTRDQNEDSMLIDRLVYNCIDMEEVKELDVDNGYKHFFIADGLGGEEKGEVASGMVLKHLADKDFESKIELASEIKVVKNQMESYSQENENIMLGTTVAGVVIKDKNAFALNIGDTRIYNISNNSISQLSVDHTLASEEVKKGRLAPNRLRHHPMRNFLTSSINGSTGLGAIKMSSTKVEFNENDIILILSDGVWEQFENYELFGIFHTIHDLKEAVAKLYNEALENSKDNLSIIAIKK